MEKRTTLIGASVPRPDAVDKVRGEARYVDDLAFPGMLHVAVVRSPHPHAKVLSIDASKALGEPDVVCVVTHRDVPGANVVHVIYDDQPALADGVVRYIGEPVALVGAVSRRAARKATLEVRVEYEALPAVTDTRRALESGAPVICVPAAAEGGGNVFNRMVLVKGDVDTGFGQADVVVEGEYETGYQEHAYLEPQGAIAVPDEAGSMAVYASMQCPFYVQGAVAKALGLPLAKVRVVQTTTGGAFGGKEDVPSQIATLAALVAWTARRPAKLVLDRGEDVLTTSKRHPSRVHYRTGAKADGTITAIDVDVVLDAGAYQTLSSAVLWRSLVTAAGPYRVPNVHVVARSVATNTVPNGAFRGFGSPQVIFPHESQMDRIAERLGLDRAEVRRRNVLRPGDRTSTDHRIEESVGIAETLDRAVVLADWAERLSRVEAFNKTHADRHRGLGISCVLYGVGLGGKAPSLDKAGATMKLEADGSVTVAVGTVEMGQGLSTAILQVASEALGIPMERVHLAPMDTSRVPDGGPTVASRGTMMAALAVLDAARKLRERVVAVAREVGIPDAAAAERWSEIARAFWTRNVDPAVEGWAKTEPVSWDPTTGLGDAYPVYAFATHVAEVEVDLATGEAHVVDFAAAHDSGTILNRALAAGQVEGGIAQGLGFALSESIPQKEGRLVVNGLTTYRLPTIRDVPLNARVDFVEAAFPAGPFGMKGIGEVPLMAAHAAVARAVAHAMGRDPARYPLDPPYVRELLSASA
ncbi:MAG: xanthine dehydrogenase family protein molybdopterin-binding subunit [Candidatus Bipolaricaulota bacterium]|nr:xanthine dehydrogenase family protein molybdopterin-binding subunit [Candidatus Bipolaricaulota bacterium]